MQTLEEIDFKEGEFVLSVRVEPQSETVWLNRQQMAQLFGRDVIAPAIKGCCSADTPNGKL